MHSGQCSKDISTSEECTDPDGNSVHHNRRAAMVVRLMEGLVVSAGPLPRAALLQICGIVVAGLRVSTARWCWLRSSMLWIC